MEGNERQEIVWTYRWQVHPAPPGLAAWLVDNGGQMEPAHATFFAFQIREASTRAVGSIPKYVTGVRRGDQLRFEEPPPHFMEVTGEYALQAQEIFVFLPATISTSERMPWVRVGVNVFFQEEEARRISKERREAAGTAVAVARAGVGFGEGGPGGDDEAE